VAVLSLFSPLVRAQRPTSVTSVPFAEYVPASANLFVSVPRLDKADEALQRAHAARLVPLLAGRSGGDGTPFDLLRAVMGLIELDRSVPSEALMESQIGVAAGSWTDFGRAVWFLRPRQPEVIERWFPPERRIVRGTAQATRFFRTPSGVTVYLHDGTAVVSRHWGPESLLHATTQLMTHGGGEALSRSAVFRNLVAHLPADCLGTAYVAVGDQSTGDQRASPLGLPSIKECVLALYERDQRLNIAIQAAVATPRPVRKLSREAVARLLRLPHTTLFASVMTFDFSEALESAPTGRPDHSWARYLTLLAAIAAEPDGVFGRLADLGPHVVLAWGQDLRESRSAPQLAVLIESREEAAGNALARRFADTVIGLVHAIEPGAVAADLAIREHRHLGVPVYSIPLKAYAAESELTAMKILADAEPSWAVWKGWLILALSRDHLERILEAQLGMFPVLASVEDVQALHGRHTARSAIAVVQAGLAANVLNQWVAASKRGSNSLLDPAWWARAAPAPPVTKPRLGIGMKVDQEPGVVVVARVYPDTAADGRLMPEDRILGIDGALLSLSSPNADLRDRWTASQSAPGPTVRVLRADRVMDITLPKLLRRTALADPRISPADAVGELASLGRAIPFLSLAVQPTDDTHFSALFSLRLAPASKYGSTGQ
jgi:hypothetical protein